MIKVCCAALLVTSAFALGSRSEWEAFVHDKDYSCGVTQGQTWLSQGTLDVLVILFGIRRCALDALVMLFGTI